jgi:hypothetical protein
VLGPILPQLLCGEIFKVQHRRQMNSCTRHREQFGDFARAGGGVALLGRCYKALETTSGGGEKYVVGKP